MKIENSMPISPDKITKLRASTVLNPDIVDKLINGWDTFSQSKQEAISKLIDLSENANSFLLQKAAERYPTFPTDLTNFISSRLRSATMSEESEENNLEDKKMGKLMQEIAEA
ncbi:MAG: hypothetical protein K9L85_03000 [Candidatus Peribacteraceae bacterium]|nr:hypothetical protein [Candidatus Peribacteraceae bacterium]